MSRFTLYEVLQSVKKIVVSGTFLVIARKSEIAFTRLRKMSFGEIIYFMLSSKSRCVQYELDEFFKHKGTESMSRQAFAKAREKIRPEAIRTINEGIIADFEKGDDYIETLHNHRVFAVDGSLIDLPENKILRDTFGYTKGSNNSSHCKARAMVGYDLLNHICVYGELINLSIAETTKMHDISDYFAEIETYDNCIFVLDRAYPSLELIKRLENNNQFYLMRATKSFYKTVVNTNNPDEIVTIKKKKQQATVRVIKFVLNSGETEILITNLSRSFTYNELVSLYAKRWGIETTYHYLKNVELLECFTGESVTAVLQDFYASIIMLNFAAITYREQAAILDDDSAENPKKYRYKPNTKQIICDIKSDFVKMIYAKTSAGRAFRQLLLTPRIKRFSYAEVEGRSRPRKDPKRHSTLKTHPKSPL